MQRFHWTPSEYASMDEYEKAFVVAALDKIIEAEHRDR
jgi:hypothetical protein